MNRRIVPVAVAAAVLWVGPASAAEPWLGRWAIAPKACAEEGDTAETMPLIIRARTLEWFVARCTYRAVAKRGERWHINARCLAEGETGPTPIVLQMSGGKLVVRWDGGKPNEMHRCP